MVSSDHRAAELIDRMAREGVLVDQGLVVFHTKPASPGPSKGPCC